MSKNTVYVLGAGFSAAAGLPTMANFLEKAKDIAQEQEQKKPDEKLKGLLEEIDKLSNIKNYCKINLLNIEEAFSILMTEHWLGKNNYIKDMQDLIELVINKYTPKINDALNENLSGELDIKNLIKKDNPYQKIFCFLSRVMNLRYKIDMNNKNRIIVEKFNNDERNDIITLNYDLLLENCLEIINRHVTENNKIEFSENFSKLYKLHGSIGEGNIVPPTWAKYSNDDNNAYLELKERWKEAFDKVSNANEIVFIGYSFPETDSYFQYFFKSAMHYSKNLKEIIIIAPDNEGVTKARYEKILGSERLKFRNKKWEQFDFEAAFWKGLDDEWYNTSETLISG